MELIISYELGSSLYLNLTNRCTNACDFCLRTGEGAKEDTKWLKGAGQRVRVNTNGHANLIHGRDVTAEMPGLFDTVSISLNNKNAKEYQRQCRSKFGEAAYDALLEFGKLCAGRGIETIFTVVDILPDKDIALCGEIARNHGGALRHKGIELICPVFVKFPPLRIVGFARRQPCCSLTHRKDENLPASRVREF